VQTIPAGKGVMAFEPAKNWRTAWVTGPDEDKVVIVDLVTRLLQLDNLSGGRSKARDAVEYLPGELTD
jgi:hypothetical protein